MIGDHSGGNESFYKNILQAMIFPPTWRVFLLLKQEADASPYEGRFIIIRFRSTNAVVRNYIEVPMIAKRLGFDLLHMQYFIPFFCPCPVVCTIHDICFEHFKNIFTGMEYIRQKRLVPYAAKKSKVIFTVSSFSKQDIIGKYKISPERIIVTYSAVDECFRVLDKAQLEEDLLRSRFGIGNHPYILTVGNLQPRKNIPRLIEAFKRLKAQSRDAHSGNEIRSKEDLTKTSMQYSDYKLVIVGKKAWMYDDILRSADDEDIILTDYVEDTDLVRLYNAAELFVYPSFFEGFGLPPLEAMACGTPVAVANTTSLPEVVGDAGLYFDPFNVENIQQVLEVLIVDKTTRDELIDKGLDRIKKFSWIKSAQLIIDQYKRCIQG